jgi:hypothetical protein
MLPTFLVESFLGAASSNPKWKEPRAQKAEAAAFARRTNNVQSAA